MKYSQAFQHGNFFSWFLRQKPSEHLQTMMDEIFEEQLKGQQGALEAITANFSAWVSMSPEVRFDEGVIIGMGRSGYTKPYDKKTTNRWISYEAMHSTVLAMEAHGLLTYKRGWKNRETGESMPSFIKPIEKFFELQDAAADDYQTEEELELSWADWMNVALDNGRPFYAKEEGNLFIRPSDEAADAPVDTMEADRALASFRDINAAVMATEYSIDCPSQLIKDSIPLAYIKRWEGNNAILNSACFLYDRSYSSNDLRWDRRFYASASNIMRAVRKHLCINGKRATECDFKALHLVLCLALEGALPQGKADLYTLSTLSEERHKAWRPLIKSCALALIDATNPSEKSWKMACLRAYEQATAKAEKEARVLGLDVEPSLSLSDALKLIPEIKAALEKEYPALTSYIASNAGVSLMRLDSDIAEIIRTECAANGVGFHLLHDGFYCEPEHAEYMVELMQYAFHKVVGASMPAHLIKVVP